VFSKMKSMFGGAKPTILWIDTLSYSGTTWLNLMLGSHPKAFSLGPPDRSWNMRAQGFDTACMIHGKDCAFWNGFGQEYQESENFLEALAKKTEATHFIFDNPGAGFIKNVIDTGKFNIKRMRYVRDGRAVTASWARKNAGTSYYDSILPSGWIYHSFLGIPDPAIDPDKLVVKYEDATGNPRGMFETVGKFIGLEYDDSALRFWEHDHHITSGNQGPVAMIKMHQGLFPGNWESRELYEQQLERLKTEPDKPFSDERWREQLSRDDLFFFDVMLGAKNAQLGYDRDDFSADAAEIVERYRTDVESGAKKPMPLDAMKAYDRIDADAKKRMLGAIPNS
jgi:hypothetical protein